MNSGCLFSMDLAKTGKLPKPLNPRGFSMLCLARIFFREEIERNMLKKKIGLE